ncbi:MAG: hypothetical protein KGJ52_02145 [Gammaproteobacteria bacterium]|nr:hypothetical protein [Gammaproteobacteria bacterium]
MSAVPVALACGDKLLGMGGGAPFARIHPGHYVAQILYFIRPESALLALDRTVHLADSLERSGHNVSLVGNERDLEGALRKHHTDLVLAAPEDIAAVRAHLVAGADAPAIVAVTRAADSNGAGSAPLSGCQLQVSYRQGRQAAQAIDSLVGRRQGRAVPDCVSSADRR